MSKRACAEYPQCITPNSVVFYRDVNSAQGWSGGLVASEVAPTSGTVEVIPMKFVGNTASLLENFRTAPKRPWAHFHNSCYTYAVEGSKPPSRKLSLAPTAAAALPDFRVPAGGGSVTVGGAEATTNAPQGQSHRVRKSLATSKRSTGGGAARARRPQFADGVVPRGQEDPQGGKGNFIDEVDTSLCPLEQLRKVQVLEGLRRHLSEVLAKEGVAAPSPGSLPAGSPRGAGGSSRHPGGVVTNYFESLADVLVFQHPLKRPTRTTTSIVEAPSSGTERNVDSLGGGDPLSTTDERRPVRLKLVAFTSVLLANVPTTTVRVPLSYVSNAPIPTASAVGSGAAADGARVVFSSPRMSVSPQLQSYPAPPHALPFVSPLGTGRGDSGTSATAILSPPSPSSGLDDQPSSQIRSALPTLTTVVANAATTASAEPHHGGTTATDSVSPVSTLDDGRSSGAGNKAVLLLSPSPPPQPKASVAPSFSPNGTTLVPASVGRRSTAAAPQSHRHRSTVVPSSVGAVPATNVSNPGSASASLVSPSASIVLPGIGSGWQQPTTTTTRSEKSPANRTGSVAQPGGGAGGTNGPSWGVAGFGAPSSSTVPIAEYLAVDASVLEILPALLHTQHVAEEAVLNGDVNKPPVAEFRTSNGWLTIPRLTAASLAHALDLTQTAENVHVAKTLSSGGVLGAVTAFFPCDVSDDLFEGLSTCVATTWMHLQSFSLSMVQHAFLSPSAMELSFEIQRRRPGGNDPAELERHDHVLAQDAIPVISKKGIAHIVSAVGFRWSQSPQRGYVGPTVTVVNPPRSRVPLAWLTPLEILALAPRSTLAPLVHLELSFLKLEDVDLSSNREALFFESLDVALPWLQTLSLRGNFLSDHTATRIAQLLANDVEDRARRWRALRSQERRMKRSLQRLSGSAADINSIVDAAAVSPRNHREGSMNGTAADGRADALPAAVATEGPDEAERDVPALRRLDLSLNRIGDSGAFALARALFDGRTAPFLTFLSLEGNTVTKEVKDDVLEALIVPSSAPAWCVARHGRCERSVRRRVLVLAFCLLRCRDRVHVENAAMWTDLWSPGSLAEGMALSCNSSPTSPRQCAARENDATAAGRQVDERKRSSLGMSSGSLRRQSMRDAFAAFGSVHLFDCDGLEERVDDACGVSDGNVSEGIVTEGGQVPQGPRLQQQQLRGDLQRLSAAAAEAEGLGTRTSIAFPFLSLTRGDDMSLSGSRGGDGGALSPTHGVNSDTTNLQQKPRKRSRVSIVEVALPVVPVGGGGAAPVDPSEFCGTGISEARPTSSPLQQRKGASIASPPFPLPGSFSRRDETPQTVPGWDTATARVRRLSLDELSYVARQHRERLQAAEKRREHEDRERLIESVAGFFSMYERRLPLAVLF